MEDSAVVELPVSGTWKAVKSPGHDRYAFDLVAVDEYHRPLRVSRVRHLAGRARAADSHSWNEPIFAPVDGTVVHVGDGWPDRKSLSLLQNLWQLAFSRPELSADDLRPFAGNHLIIRSDSIHVLLAHLRNGSLRVREGERVVAGQVVGRVGNSGLTLEPHVHFQLIDDIEGLPQVSAPPFLIRRYERWNGAEWEKVEHEAMRKGDVLRSQR